MEESGIVKVEASGTEEVRADSAVLHVTISGKKFRFQNAAGVKAGEIRPLVEGLLQLGVADTDIRVTSVSTSTESGRLTKTSSATYRLNIVIENLEHLPDALGLLSSVDDCRLTRTEWRYGDEQEQREALLKTVTADAVRRAKTMAEVAGTSIAGIKFVSDSYSAPTSAEVTRSVAAGLSESLGVRGKAASIDIGTAFVETKSVHMVVTAEFWLEAGFETS